MSATISSYTPSLQPLVNFIPDGNYTVQDGDSIISCKNWTSNHTIVLPYPVANRILEIVANSSYKMAFDQDLVEYNGGVFSTGSTTGQGIKIVSDGTNWYVILTGTNL